MSEKTEKASPFKLKKAKEQGQVAKSSELNSVIAIMVFFTVFLALWQQDLNQLSQVLKKLLRMSAQLHFSSDQIQSLFHWLLSALLSLWLPFALAMSISLILSSIAQTGFVWSSKPLTPDFSRLSLVKGFKRIYSVRLFFDLGKNLSKLFLALVVTGFSLYSELPNYLQLIETRADRNAILLVNLLFKTLFQVLIVLGLIALIDHLFSRWKYGRDQRMSKQEVKEEYKQREGDPKIKQKLKQLQQQLFSKISSMRRVKEADVVITNPTHLAIALKYERGLMPAPKLLCKAQGEMAAEVKKLARRYKVPIIENKVLARSIYKEIELNHWISPTLYAMTAEVFKEVYRLKGIQI